MKAIEFFLNFASGCGLLVWYLRHRAIRAEMKRISAQENVSSRK